MFGICYHKWGKWEQYEEKGIIQRTWQGLDVGKPERYKELRQKCFCERCNKMKDRFIRNLPA